MHKKITLLTYLMFFLVNVNGQIPFYIERSSISASSTLKDSAQNSITLLPQFNWVSSPGKIYEATVTGSLPVSPGLITIDWPKNGQIFQRDNNNNGWVYISGNVSDKNLISILVEAVPVQGTEVTNQKVLAVNNLGYFEGAIQLPGGDYNLTIKEYMYPMGQKNPFGSNTITKVGVGEVIMMMGFSYMEGGQPTAEDPEPKISHAAQDERVRTVPTIGFDPVTDNVTNWIEAMPYSFHKIENNIGPVAGNSWAYGELGDDLASRLNVPVLILSAAFGGTSIYHHERNIAGDLNFGLGWFGIWAAKGFPHAGIKAITDKYIPKTGVRAILIHHGGNDRAQINDFTNNFNIVMNDIKTRLNHNNLTAVIAIDGPYMDHPANDPNIGFVNQINNIISGNSNYFQGPNINNSIGPWRLDEGLGCGQCGHFTNNMTGLLKYAELWSSSLPNSLFSGNISFKEPEIPNHLKF